MDDAQAAKLRELAERARKPQGWKRIAFQAARLDEFREAASPDVLLALLDERDALRRQRDEQKRVIDDAYAALGPDSWWMDPPDGGSPTLAEMVAKANEDGRALYDVKRERDAALALLRDFRAIAGEHWGVHPLRARTDALLGSRFDDGEGLHTAEAMKAELRAMIDAAASPDVVTALLDERDALRRERDEALERLRVTEINLGATLQTSVRFVSERDAALALIAAHNAECERLCQRDTKGGRCEAYVTRGRECTDCPRNWMIDDGANGGAS